MKINIIFFPIFLSCVFNLQAQTHQKKKPKKANAVRQIKFTPPKIKEYIQPPTQQDYPSIVQNGSTDNEVGEISNFPVKNSDPNNASIYRFVEESPMFPGGEKSLYAYLQQNILYPTQAREANIMGKVFVRFVVNENGEVSNATILKGIEKSCDDEALRVIKKMPRWKPGKQLGKAVKVYFTLPIHFVLKD